MSGSEFGRYLKVMTFGESHGPALGCVLDGMPAGLCLSEEDIQIFLDRRRPGQSPFSTDRKEADRVEILSGLFEGRTTGAPISMLIRNRDQRPEDYEDLKDCFRPGHADYGYEAKYGIRDYLGGGRSSGRETVARVAAGAAAMKLLLACGVRVMAFTRSIGPVTIRDDNFDEALILKTPTAMPDPLANEKALAFLEECRAGGDSAGGVIECRVSGMPAGLGSPVFGKLDADLAGAVMSIGAVRAVEIGDGIRASRVTGSENNDPFLPDKDGRIMKKTNHAGGILGGISDGSDLVLRAYVKPTPSIGILQDTVDRRGEARQLAVGGRHDPVIVPRAVVVVECMCALTILDAMLENMTSRASYIIDFYGKKRSE